MEEKRKIMLRIIFLLIFVPSCATPCPVCECPPPEKIDCKQQIVDEKIKAVTLLGECQAELRKYKK